MTFNEIPNLRLINQQIAQRAFHRPAELLSWMVGMQAQDYGQAKWALGTRVPGSTEVAIEQAIENKEVVRTWLMRGTIHLTAPENVRWLLGLLAPRLLATFASRDRQLQLDTATITQCKRVLSKVLVGGRQLTREELAAALAQNGISTNSQRLSHILYRAGFEQLICFGARRGLSFTYALLDEWVPDSHTMQREEALAKLAKQYFISHGPATLPDFAWWSGLSLSEAKAGLEIVKADLHQETTAGEIYYWHEAGTNLATRDNSATYLLAGFDEYILGYKDRSACLDPSFNKHVMTSNGIFNPVIVWNGQVIGTWKRTFKKDTVLIQTYLFDSLPALCPDSLLSSARAYAAFVGKKLILNGIFI